MVLEVVAEEAGCSGSVRKRHCHRSLWLAGMKGIKGSVKSIVSHGDAETRVVGVQ